MMICSVYANACLCVWPNEEKYIVSIRYLEGAKVKNNLGVQIQIHDFPIDLNKCKEYLFFFTPTVFQEKGIWTKPRGK